MGIFRTGTSHQNGRLKCKEQSRGFTKQSTKLPIVITVRETHPVYKVWAPDREEGIDR